VKRLLWLKEANTYLLGKDERIILSVCAVLSSGHVLIEDHPGVGKTTLAKIIGNLFSFDLSRVQFTNDILPSDIIGSSIFDINKQNFEFHKGPIFGDLVLADELNRAPAKTQSALLQAMEEKKVTVDRQSYDLSPHFTVFATQNPSSQIGTFDLPESQLDRFCLKFDIGYPDKESTLKMLKSDLNSKEVIIHNKISDEQLN
jgi:MoxR-like ATPase